MGQSDNSVSPYGTYSDDFDAQRWLGTGALIGDFDYDGINIKPELRLSWFREETDAYTDSLNNLVPSIEVETGTLSFGPTISTTMDLGDGVRFSPKITAKGIWTFAQENSAQGITAAANANQLADEGLRASLEAGFDIATTTASHSACQELTTASAMTISKHGASRQVSDTGGNGRKRERYFFP